jgi:hypothetical protein
MTQDEARRIARDETADPILRYDARVLLGEIERPLPKHERKRRLDATISERDFSRAWNDWCDRRIRSALAEHQKFILDTVGTALGEYVGEQRQATKREFSDELRQLRIEIAEMQAVIGELRVVLAAERNAPIGLPSPLRARVN